MNFKEEMELLFNSNGFNLIKSVAPKIASTIGLAGLSTGISHGINKALKKDTYYKNI